MSTPDQRARDKDRAAATKIVEAAWAEGQIVEADRDKRVEEIMRAQTLGEIDMMTHDLRPAPAGPAPVAPTPPTFQQPPPAYAVPETYVPYGPPTSATSTDGVPDVAAATTVRVSKAVLIVPLVLVAVVSVAVVGGIVAAVRSATDSSSATLSPGQEPGKGDVNVLSQSGYDDLVDAVKEKTGGTTAFSAVLYPTYAVVQLPVDSTTQREAYYYWDGHDLSDENSKGTSTDERFDLRSIDPAVVVNLVNKVRRLSDKPTSWYAVVGGPRVSDRSMIWAYASNEYSESVYLGARRDGTIVYDSTNP